MWNWLQENHGVVAAIASVLTLGIWTLYFQLLYSNYRHRLRSQILIARCAGHTVAARCIVANMSAEAVYIEAILLELKTADDTTICSLSDLNISLTADFDTRSQSYQGPLSSGEHIDVGSYQDLIHLALKSMNEEDAKTFGEDNLTRIRIMAIGTYTAENGIVAAEREFDLKATDTVRLLQPRSLEARQIRTRGERRKVEEFMLEWYAHRENPV